MNLPWKPTSRELPKSGAFPCKAVGHSARPPFSPVSLDPGFLGVTGISPTIPPLSPYLIDALRMPSVSSACPTLARLMVMADKPPKVFVSYSHEESEHEASMNLFRHFASLLYQTCVDHFSWDKPVACRVPVEKPTSICMTWNDAGECRGEDGLRLPLTSQTSAVFSYAGEL
jgi:hypothetical protein